MDDEIWFGPWANALKKADFYQGEKTISIEWWLSDCDCPNLTWARLRLFANGRADVCWREGTTLYGFVDLDSARHYLAEDEYRKLLGMDDEDFRAYGVQPQEVCAPVWSDSADQEFQYVGIY